MNLLKRFRKMTSKLLALTILISTVAIPVIFADSSSSSIDLLDPDFISSHGGGSVTVKPEDGKSPFEVFAEKFGTSNPVEGVTKTVRDNRPDAADRHIRNVYDADLGTYVFVVEAHDGTCTDGCFMHNTSYDKGTDTFSGGNTDRQRIEIRPVDEHNDSVVESGMLVGFENDITAYNWKMKLDKDFPKPNGFFHIFQYKAVNATGKLDSEKHPLHDFTNFKDFSSDEDGNPILTLTLSSSTLDFRWADIGTDAGMEVLSSVQTNSIKNRWVDITVKILNSECGWITMVMKDAKTGEILMEYNDPNRMFDMWRRPEVKYNGKTFEGPYPAVSNMFNRPKWGIYRKAEKGNPNVPGAKLYLTDMTLYKSVVGASPVNLAYNKKAYDYGATSSNILQTKNAVPSRLTDGVQTDPVIYPVTGLSEVSDENYSHLGMLCWVGTESSKKGNVIIDLGEKMDFNQVKLFTKSLRMKNVDVYISDDEEDYTEENIGSIEFKKADDLYTDDKGAKRTFYNPDFKSDDTQDAQHVIDLGKTYSSRYVRFFFENGSGSANITTMTGPPRISEIEIYNKPQTPQNISVNYTGGSEATISWDAEPYDYFTIYDNGMIIADNITSNSYTLTNLDPGAEYNLTVRTVFTDLYSYKEMFSAEGIAPSFKTDGDPIIPNPPATVTATAASDKSVQVAWDSVTDAQSYRVLLATDACERTIVDNYEGISYTIMDLSPGTEYTVKIHSIRRGTPSALSTEAKVTTTGIKNPSDNLLFNKEVRYSRVWSDNTSSYGGQKALDNDTSDGSRWVGIKGSETAYLMVDIGEITPVQVLEYYSYQNRLMRVSFYYSTDGEAFTDPDSNKWEKIITVDRVAEGTYENSEILKIEEKITLDKPINARYIKFTVDETGGDINVNEVKAFGPISFVDGSTLIANEITDSSAKLEWNVVGTTMPAKSYNIYQDNIKIETVAASVYSYDVLGLLPNTEYIFRVKAISEAVHESVYETFSGLICTVVTLLDTSDKEAPTWPSPELEASNIGTTAATLTWSLATDNVGVIGYRIFYGNKMIEVDGNKDSYRVTGLTSNTSYIFTIQAIDAGGNLTIDGPTVTVKTLQETTYEPDSETSEPSSKPTPKPTAPPVESIVEGTVVRAPVPTGDTKTGEFKTIVNKKAIDDAFANAEDSVDKKTISIEIPRVDGAKVYMTEIPAEYVTEKNSAKSLKLKTEFATVTLPGNMLSNTGLRSDSQVGIKVKTVDTAALSKDIQQKVGDRPIISLSLLVDGNNIEFNNPDAPVTISIPYTPSAEELANPEHIVVWYIDNAGNVICVPNGKYDAATGTVIFETTHFSMYAIAYVVKTFDDIAGFSWAKKQIEVLASKGIINGITEKMYAPGVEITRADFTKLLVNTLEFTSSADDNFNDVKSTDYFYKEVGIAKALGIINGVGNNNFNPREVISRQDMMTITARSLSLANKLEGSASLSDLSKFTDKDSISDYAVQSVAELVKDGLILGSDGKINPKGTTTRAEVAIIIYRIYYK